MAGFCYNGHSILRCSSNHPSGLKLDKIQFGKHGTEEIPKKSILFSDCCTQIF